MESMEAFKGSNGPLAGGLSEALLRSFFGAVSRSNLP